MTAARFLALYIVGMGVLGGQPGGGFYAWGGALLALGWLLVALYDEQRNGRRRYVEAERQRKVDAAVRGAPCEFCGGSSEHMRVWRDYDTATLACVACTEAVRGRVSC